MKCSLDRVNIIFKIRFLKFLVLFSVLNLEGVSGKTPQSYDMLKDFDYLVSQLYLQHCTFVEIGEGVCSLFVELTMDDCKKKPVHKQIFFGNCLCSEFRKWHLCSYQLSHQRREDCAFEEESCPSSSARVHRRLCDVTGMSQWNTQCNCSITLAGGQQNNLCGFKTCYATPIPRSICGPRTVCGTARCDINVLGSLYGVKCDRKCKDHQPFCEKPGPATSLKRIVSSEWTEWKAVSPSDNECNIQQFEADCLDERKKPAYDCLGPGLLCCGKEETDCICEVKIQDGIMKAFRYMIKFGEECDSNYSKLKVRSTGLKGDIKVWNRLIGMPSRDESGDSVSMFSKHSDYDSYWKKNKPHELNNIKSEILQISMENSGIPPNENLFHQLAIMMNNRSQAEQDNGTSAITDDKSTQFRNFQGVSHVNDTMKLLNADSKGILQDQNGGLVNNNFTHLNLSGGKQHFGTNENQFKIMSNDSGSNFNKNVQSQQMKMQQMDEMFKKNSTYNFTSLPKSVDSDLKNSSQDLNEKSNGAKDSGASSELNKIKYQANNNHQEFSENSQFNESNKKTGEQYQDQSNKSYLNNSVNETKQFMPYNLNILPNKSMITSSKNISLNVNINNEEKNMPTTIEIRPLNQDNINVAQNKETNINKEEFKDLNNNTQLTEKLETKDDKIISNNNNHQSEVKGFDTKSHEKDGRDNEKTKNHINKVDVALNKENTLPSERKSGGGTVIEGKSSNTEIENTMQKNNGNDFKGNNQVDKSVSHSSNIIVDNIMIKSKDNQSISSQTTDKVINKKSFIAKEEKQINEINANSQENISMDIEEKEELTENEFQQGISAQEKQKDSKEKVETASSSTVLINQEVIITTKTDPTLLAMDKMSTGKSFTEPLNQLNRKEKLEFKNNMKESLNTTPNIPIVAINQVKQQNASHLSNIKMTTMDLQNKGTRPSEDKINENTINEQPPKHQLNVSASMVGVSQKSTIPSLTSKGPSINREAPSKTGDMSDIANILPNITPNGMVMLSSKRRSKPHFHHEHKENGINLNIRTMTTPDLFGSIAKKLFKSRSQVILNDQDDPLRTLSDSNSAILLPHENTLKDYDEPEPILKDLGKVDKDNVEEQLADALSKVVDLKGLSRKTVWSEKPEDHEQLVLESDINMEDKHDEFFPEKISTSNVRNEKKNKLAD